MCGIAGIIDSTQATPPGVLREMLAAIRHRGPDGEGTHVEPGVAIGMRRLAVIDLATGNQPLRARGGQVLVFQNGEIYNYRALRTELERAGRSVRHRERHRDPRAGLRPLGHRRAAGAHRRHVCIRDPRPRARDGCTSRATASARSRCSTPRGTAASPTARTSGPSRRCHGSAPKSIRCRCGATSRCTMCRARRRSTGTCDARCPASASRSRSTHRRRNASVTTCRRSAPPPRSPTMRSRPRRARGGVEARRRRAGRRVPVGRSRQLDRRRRSPRGTCPAC